MTPLLKPLPILAALLTSLLPLAFPSLHAASADAGTLAAGPFLGRWDLTIREQNREIPSWLELTVENGSIQSRFVGRWGHARKLPRVEIHSDELVFSSP